MVMKFQTKDESNRAQEQAFLKLAPAERFLEFLKLCYELKDFPSIEKAPNNNFVIELKDRNVK